MRRCHAIHPTPVTGCRLCELAAASAYYQRRWGLPVTADPARDVVAVPAACRHFAGHTRAERAALGLPRDRDTGTCGLGYGTAAGHSVCRCWRTPSGCVGCPGFELREAE